MLLCRHRQLGLKGAGAVTSRASCSRRAPPQGVCRASSAVDRRLPCDSTQALCLHMAEEELSSLCAAKGTPEEKAKCYEVWQYYHDRRLQAEAGCSAEGGAGASCDVLDSLEKLVYEVACTGDAEQLYHVLKTQSNMAKRAAGHLESEPAGPSEQDRQKARALALFAQADVDGDGVINREEFLAAMKVLQHALSDSEMALALSCMDSHGFITPEQFASIVAAEDMCETTSDAEVLRHVPHSRPSWWSDAPHCVTDV